MDAAESKQSEPNRDRVCDLCCRSSGIFVQSVEFVRAHASGNDERPTGGKAQRGPKPDIFPIYGQKSNYTTWRLAKRTLAIRGIDGQIVHGETFHNNHHPGLKADFTNPPFKDGWRPTTLGDPF
jgi:type I restriction enzyme M protein